MRHRSMVHGWFRLLLEAAATAALLLGVEGSSLLARPAAPLRADVKIKFCPGVLCVGQSYTFDADGTPPGGTYTWKVVKGADRVTPTSGSGKTFTLTGVAASAAFNDVRLQVTYKGVEDRCDLFVAKVQLQSLSLAGMQNGFRPVVQDDGSSYHSAPRQPDWLDVNLDGKADDAAKKERRVPALYIAGGKVTVVDVTADVKPADFKLDGVALQGTGTDGSKFTGTGSIHRGRLTVKGPLAGNALAKAVKFYNPYEIQWEASLSEDVFCPIGRSDNRIYVPLNAPVTGTTLYETVCELSCRNADGAIDLKSAAARIWGEFTDRDVRRKPMDGLNQPDGGRMSYYVPPTNACYTYAVMLRTGNGQCSAWAQLLVQMTRVQGLAAKDPNKGDEKSLLVEVHTDTRIRMGANAGSDGFLVKDWAFKADKKVRGIAGYPFVIGKTATDRRGVPGQNNADPPSSFNNHWVVWMYGKLYDPSYGTGDYASELKHEDAALDGIRALAMYAKREDANNQDLLYTYH